MSRRRALLICPGRGSYDRRCLGSLQDRSDGARTVIEACDAWRTQHGRPTVSELDADEAFRASRHVAGEHASLLTFACSLADAADLDRDRYEVVGVAGNSMGWYTALAVSGALELTQAVRLVDTLGSYQAGNVIGGQLITPICDENWAPSATHEARVEAALAHTRAQGHTAEWSIRLGGYAVLGADAAGIKHLLATLPPDQRGSRTFPLQLPLHSAFHTPLMAETSARAVADLGDLPIGAPGVPLIDGRGQVYRPRWADPDVLLDYTLGHQITQPYDFTTSVETALRHVGADVVICLGPGNALGGPVARILVNGGWHGVGRREDLDALQRTHPVLLSFGVAMQREALV